MSGLTAKEVSALNKLAKFTMKNFKFGDRLQTLLGDVVTGTPVNAVNASSLLTLTGVVKDGETVTINNPAVAGTDVYEFLADTLQTLSDPANKAVDITASTGKATGTLTLAVQPTAGDTLIIGSKVYTFVTAGEASDDGEVSRGDDLAGAKAALVGAINGEDGRNIPHPLVTAAAFVGNDCAITALVGGTAGNSISTTETFANAGNVFAATTLLTGTDCSAANACAALIAAVNAADTQAVEASAGTGTKVLFTADVAGIAGNEIVPADTLPNGAFAGAKMTGGINGTVGTIGTTLIDASYVYHCVADNTISGKNWRRISLGSAF